MANFLNEFKTSPEQFTKMAGDSAATRYGFTGSPLPFGAIETVVDNSLPTKIPGRSV